MREINTMYAINVRNNVSQIQNFLNLAILFMVIAGFTYLTFYTVAMSDKFILESGAPFLEPLAKLLHPNDMSVGIYKLTAFKLFASVIPVFLVQYLITRVEESLISQHNLKREKQRQKEYLEELRNFEGRFDSIKTYTICLSLDYESENEISPKNRKVLNDVIFSKISNSLASIDLRLKIAMKEDVLIVVSDGFENYDAVYDEILSDLSSVKEVIEKKYSYKLTPSITTDAFSETDKGTSRFNSASIRKQHYEIQSFNFKNRALTTATFANKYRHLNQNKYAGIPIGEYVYFKDDKTRTYELNVIHKNLSKTLTQVKT